jgi:hypothetical protein
LTSTGGTWMVNDSTLMVGGGSWTIDGSTLMSDIQHQLDNAIAYMTQHHCLQHDSVMTSRHRHHRLDRTMASMTRLHHHQAKQHLPIC